MSNGPLSVAQVQSIGAAAGGIGQLVGGIAGAANQKELEARASANLDTALQELEDLKASQPSLATPSAYYEGVKGAYDQRLLQMRMDDINRS